MSVKSSLVGLILFAALPGFSSDRAFAQNVGGTIQGTVTDSSRAAVPGVVVVIRNTRTGASRELVTDGSGSYRAPLLPPGEYEVKASLKGFQTVERRGIELAVGQDALVDLTLKMGALAEEVVVLGAVSQVELTSGAVSGLVSEQEIRALPLNGRSFQQLALLQPGVQAALAAGNDVVGGRTPKISINGARPEQNNFLLDGTDINNVYNKTPGSAAGVLLGVDAVLEFQVLTNAYSAEFGRSAGGVINAVTRSGTNDVHGSAFEFHRNSALDARNFFDPPGTKPDFTRHQFGAVAGGPLQRNRTFFFGVYEGLVERLDITGVTAVPDDNARMGILPSGPVTLHSAIPQYLDVLFPHGNGAPLGGGAQEYLFTPTQPTDEHFFQGRVDHRLSSNDSLFVRYTYDRAAVDRIPPDKPPISIIVERTRNTYVTVEHQHGFSPNTLNVLRGGVNRSVSLADNRRTIDIPPSMSWIPGDPFGYLTIRGMVTEMAGDFRLPRDDRLSNWQLADTLVLTRGPHALRAGVQTQYLQFNQHTTSQVGGIVNFANLQSFLQGRAISVDFAVPGKIDPDRRYRQWLFGAFLQDDIRLGRFSANLGVRYEVVTVPTEADGKISNLRNVTDPQLTVGGQWHANPSLRNIAPRVGLAWDPVGDNRTSIRGGFGIFYDEILPKYYFFSGSLNPPFTTRTSIQNPPFPNVVANFDPNAPIRAQLQTVNYDLRTPYLMQFNANVQRALTSDLDVAVGYVGSRGRNLLRLGDANLAPEEMVNGVKTYHPELGRRNPNFQGIWQRVTDATSEYNSLQVGVHKRLSHGWRAQLSYTLSKSTDDSSGINSQDFSNVVQYGLDWYDPQYDRGPSAFDTRHNVTFNGTWELPFFQQRSGLTGALLKGWALNNITTLRSGHPFTVQLGFNRSGNLNTTSFSMHERPDVVPGCDPILGLPSRYWDIRCFAMPPVNQRGNAPRNSLTGPGLAEVDLALVKSFAFGPRRLELRAECFNLLNHPNFAVPSGRTAFTGVNPDGSSIVAPTWGRITATATTARQIQLGLKMVF